VSAVHAFISHRHTEWLDAADSHHCAFHRHKLTCTSRIAQLADLTLGSI